MRIEYSDVMDKSEYGDGPWQNEPDKIQWIDEETDLDCLIVRNQMGALCGYVGITEDHPRFGKGYDDDELGYLEVHGGPTFADSCAKDENQPESICHLPAPGRSDNVWWIGFDCAHYMDLVPRIRTHYDEVDKELFDRDESYKDVEYVTKECRNLAQQLAAEAV